MKAAAIAAIALAAVMLSSIGAVPSYAQSPLPEPITLSADKEEPYAAGETVTVTGQVARSLQGAIAVLVSAPNGNRAFVDQVTLGDDNTFEFSFTAGGPQWMEAGTYTIKATYGPTAERAVSGTATIEFTGGAPAPAPEPEPEPEPASPVDPVLAGIEFDIVGGEVVSIAPGTGAPSILITINAEEDGMITLTIPRSILDSRTEGQEGDDVPFSVLVNDEIADATEDSTPTTRTLVIEFSAGDGQVIEVIGSFIIPEFGAVAVVVLAAAIVAIVAIGSRSRLGIMPRY
ncbi:MAG: PEFG-CTERM sorting domain-containing protein [Thaumarchaeota archaeon]|nr:PEFG-CTERM sorting domain-containing protein [Nitrososphaerota archaeon]MDD9813462.1 PEFG-CTERM sorting domain-containing protein [Nitrososphaerota archaeon]MDD9826551.1 PEFG-CTERM sorting domain-containing protein [Nitrososphaerota archaeon]MDD9843532.1 PEFG-CTERM sorting domain-containing protein [Nitrososphaerota archaeon]